MKTIGLDILLQSPALLAAAPPASNLTETLLFIPGNTVRGLLARRYLDLEGAADSVFEELFVKGEVRFGFAWAKPEWARNPQVIPLSARSCKYQGGFNNDEGHGVLDLLLSGQEEKRCPKCKQSIDYFQGFWDISAYRKIPMDTRLITRTAIDSIRGAARTGQLYSQRVLEEGQSFHANIEVPSELASHFTALLSKLFIGRIGTGSSRGQGWVEVSQNDPMPIGWESTEKRYERFFQREGKPVLVVTLLSDGLFRDDYLRDCTAPTIGDLIPLGIVAEDWCPYPTRAFMDTRLIFGFDGKPIFLPRQPRLAVAAGSVFLFKAKQNNLCIPAGEGIGWIGEENREGYGRAVLWHPFHLQPEREAI
ncbi:MAG: RAMP superfamily CRISPR-associated protein [Gammaproteobacteria bacterium]